MYDQQQSCYKGTHRQLLLLCLCSKVEFLHKRMRRRACPAGLHLGPAQLFKAEISLEVIRAATLPSSMRPFKAHSSPKLPTSSQGWHDCQNRARCQQPSQLEDLSVNGKAA